MSGDKNKTEWIFQGGAQPQSPGAGGGGLPPLGGGPASPAPQVSPAAPAAGGATIIDTGEMGPEAAGQTVVVGWLVVVEGPGRGRSVEIGPGSSSIGRDASERIALPFGDSYITGRSHARLIYELESRKFYLSHDQGQNVTKLNGKVVGAMEPLQGGDVIQFGPETKALFVALDYDWSREEEAGGA